MKNKNFCFNLSVEVKGPDDTDWEELLEDIQNDLNCVLAENFNICRTFTSRNHNCKLTNIEVYNEY